MSSEQELLQPSQSTILVGLRNVTALLYPDESSARRIVADAGVDARQIAFDSRATNNWHHIWLAAIHQNRVDALFAVLADEYPGNPSLQSAIANYQRFLNAGGRLNDQAFDDDAPAPGDPPYQGMAYYDVADADRFFGREALTAELIDHLRQQPLLAVVGASGSGKSSLVRAGVLPALQGKKPLIDGKQPPTGSARWAYHLITPTARPLESLAASLTRSSESVTATSTFIDDLRRDHRSLHLYARRLVSGEQRLLLLVDQFEELFTLCKERAERQAFVENLLYAVQPTGVVTLILTLRADFYHHCADFPALRTALETQQRYIGAMTPDELRRAIEEPAHAANWAFQPGLVEQLLHDVGDEPGALPLLSHALLETWQRRRGRTLTLAGYRAAGGVQGAIAKTADDVYNRFTDEQKTIARIIFLRLTELGEGVQDTRRRVRPAELKLTQANPDVVQQVLKTLADARLVTTAEEEVQVAHEALIRHWATLRAWLDDDREGQRIQRRLTEAANQWVEFERDTNLLYRGVLLQQAKEWLKNTIDPPNQIEMIFLQASTKAEERIQKVRRLVTQVLVALTLVALIAASAAWIQTQRVSTTNTLLETANNQLQITNAQLDDKNKELDQTVNDLDATNLQLQQTVSETQRLANIAVSRQQAALARERFADNYFLHGSLLALQAVQRMPTVESLEVLYDAETYSGKLLTQFRHKSNSYGSIWGSGAIWSKDEQIVLSWANGSVGVWDAATGQPIHTLQLADEIKGATWSQNEQRILSWSSNGDGKMWDATSGNRLFAFSEVNTGPVWIASNGMTLSKDEQRILSWGEGDIISLWDANTGQQLLTLHNRENVSGAILSKDEQHILSWGYDGFLSTWDINNGQQLLVLRHDGSVNGAVWSKDEQHILSWSEDYTIGIWDVDTGKRVHTLRHGSVVRGATWNKDEQHILSWGFDGLTLWNAATGQRLRNFYHESYVYGAVWSKNEQRILFWGDDGALGIVDTDSEERSLSLRHNDGVYGATWSKDEQRILSWSFDGTVSIWDAINGERLFTFDHESPVRGAVWSKNEQRVLSWSDDGAVNIWDAASDQHVSTFHQTDSTYGVYSVDWSKDEQRIVAWSIDNARIWDVATGQPLFMYQITDPQSIIYPNDFVQTPLLIKLDKHIQEAFTGYLSSFSLDRDGIVNLWNGNSDQPLFEFADSVKGAELSHSNQRVLAWNDIGTMEVWNLTSGQRLFTVHGEESISGAAWSKDEQRILSWGGGNGTIKVWNANNGQHLLTLRHERGGDEIVGSIGIREAVWNKDGRHILFWSYDGTVGVWNAINGESLLALYNEHGATGARWSKDEQHILSWGEDIGIWNAGSGQRLLTLRSESSIANAVWNKDEQRILSWSYDGTVGVWDAKNGQRLVTLRHEDSVIGAVWSKDEQRILSWSKDGTIGIWDAVSGQRLFSLRHEGAVYGTIWSQDEKHVLSWSKDGTVRVWTTDIPKLLQKVCELIPRNFTETEWRTYFGVEPYQRTCPAHAHLLGAAKRAAVETGNLARVEALFAQAVAVARQEDNVTLTLDPHAEAIRYTAPVLASRANAAALACNVAEAVALYQQVRDLAPHFFPGDPQVIVPALAEQNGCPKPTVSGSIIVTLNPPPPSPTVTPPATGTSVASTPVATPGQSVTSTLSSP